MKTQRRLTLEAWGAVLVAYPIGFLGWRAAGRGQLNVALLDYAAYLGVTFLVLRSHVRHCPVDGCVLRRIAHRLGITRWG